MNHLRVVWPQLRLPASGTTLVALLCTQVPLFNYLGFEFSVLLAAVLSFLSGLVAIAYFQTSTSLAETVKKTTLASAVLLFVPLVILSVNALFVKNCSFVDGIIYYLLLPLPSVIFSVALAFLLCALNVRWKKSWFVVALIVILLQIPYVTFAGVQIFAFNPVVGYFPGITYDESLDILDRLILYRLVIVAAGALFLLAAVLLDRKRRGLGLLRLSRGEQIVAAVFTVIVVGAIVSSHRLGFSSSEEFVRERLGGFIETDHFEITYPVDAVDEERLNNLVRLHEFQFDQLTRELRVAPHKKIKSFLYATAEQKGRLIGAGRTNIAKPWLWQLHINLEDVERSLRHELVHVLAADFGFPLLRVSLNSGLIEGLAMATERTAFGEHLHRLAAMAFATNTEFDVKELFSVTGFMRAHQGMSYTMAGSFCRFLIDRYGLRRFKRVYRTGSFVSAYNKRIEDLVHEWQQFLSGFRISRSHLMKGAYLFQRPSIFRKECARVIADLNETARTMFQQKQYERAFRSAQKALTHTNAGESINLYAQSLLRLGRYEEVIGFVHRWIQDSSVGHTLIPLYLVLGDAQVAVGPESFGVGNLDRARESYEELITANLSLSLSEEAAIRVEMLRDPLIGKTIYPVILKTVEDSVALQLLRQTLEKHPSNQVVRYLLAREFAVRKDFAKAVELFESTGRFGREILEYARQRRIALAYFQSSKYQKAKIHFWLALNHTHNDADAIEIREWLDRCDWFEKNTY
ncbi:MAG TPA: hypothetical protein VNN76_10025 [Bacteroidota bacterium]|nr:hypothetical protein [Bacteroidota bacterium]